MRDHYSPRVKFAITAKNATFNDNARGWRLAREALKYALFREGFLASTSVPVRMYIRTREGLASPDATISVLPFLYEMVGRQRRVARRRGITMNINVLRSESVVNYSSVGPGSRMPCAAITKAPSSDSTAAAVKMCGPRFGPASLTK